MWTMGDDFQYQYAESWFKQMDKLIHYVNKVGLTKKNFIYGILILKLRRVSLFFFSLSLSPSLCFPFSSTNFTYLLYAFKLCLLSQDGRVNALYSTPSIYTDAKYAANESWPLKADDYFP